MWMCAKAKEYNWLTGHLRRSLADDSHRLLRCVQKHLATADTIVVHIFFKYE